MESSALLTGKKKSPIRIKGIKPKLTAYEKTYFEEIDVDVDDVK